MAAKPNPGESPILEPKRRVFSPETPLVGTNIAGVSGPTVLTPPGGRPAPIQTDRMPSPITRSYFTENPWQLSAAPTIWVVGGACAFAMLVLYVLQNHILSTKDHYAVFLLGSYLVFSSYFLVYYYLERLSSSFHKVSPDKKFYTISNLIKAGVLAAITPFGAVHLYQIIVFDQWDGNTLRNLGCIYAIPDFVSLIVVRRMSTTTIVHHVCVCIFNYFSVHNDYAQENICRLIVVYAAFSTFAYCVNMLLASRFLGVPASVARVLSMIALVVYVTCCAVNWMWQIHYLRHLIKGPNNHWTIYLYMVLICFVMWDDLVLNKWLLQNARTYKAEQMMQSPGGGGGTNGDSEATARLRAAKLAEKASRAAAVSAASAAATSSGTSGRTSPFVLPPARKKDE